jgi:type IV pilus assembly protein PilW
LLRDDIQLAGFYGEIDIAGVATKYPLTTFVTPPDLCATALLERTQDLPLPAGESPGLLQIHVQGVNNFDASTSTALDSCPTIKSAVKTGTDVILVRRAKTCFAGVGDCDTLAALNGKPALQISFCTKPTPAQVSASKVTTHALALYPNAGEFKHMHNIAAGSPVGTDCSVASELRPYVVYMYFVGTDNVLKRAELRFDGTATNMTNVTPLVDGIENLQLDYGLDNVGIADGNADSYTASPATVDDWTNVVSVQINLLARNPEASPGYTDAKTYNLGPSAGNVGPFSDGFRRHVYSARVRIQNISGRREVP